MDDRGPRRMSSGERSPRWRGFAATLGGFVLGGVFLLAAWTKALDPVAFGEQITGEGLDFLLPADVLALAVIALEAALGTALLLGVRRRWVLWPTGALVAFFLFLTGRAYWRFLSGVEDVSDCGCFGNLLSRTPAEAFWQDLVLLLPPFLLAAGSSVRSHKTGRWRIAIVVVATLAAAVFSWRSPALPLDDLATRLRPGGEIAAICAGVDDGRSERACLDLLVPELLEGRHLVVIADLTAPRTGPGVEALNELARNLQNDSRAGALWLLHSSTAEEQMSFFWEWAPEFELREVPTGLLRPLYRRLPRSFSVEGGRVVETWPGLPPNAGAAAGIS